MPQPVPESYVTGYFVGHEVLESEGLVRALACLCLQRHNIFSLLFRNRAQNLKE